MYRELAETLVFGFRRLGHQADIALNLFDPAATNILMHCHEMADEHVKRMPAGSIVFNLEQVEDRLFDWAPKLKHFLMNYEVWDYSRQNVERLKDLVPRIHYLPVGWEPELTRIERAPIQDIDVLFYGAPTERRMAIIEGLRARKVNAQFVFGVYGAERDALIARSKIVLNLHHTEAQVFEIVRVSYLLANKKAVVSELSRESDIEPDLRDAIVGVHYDKIIDACRSLIANKAKRRALETQGYKRMSARRQSTSLSELLAKRASGSVAAG
jgi:hypothetical protein